MEHLNFNFIKKRSFAIVMRFCKKSCQLCLWPGGEELRVMYGRRGDQFRSRCVVLVGSPFVWDSQLPLAEQRTSVNYQARFGPPCRRMYACVAPASRMPEYHRIFPIAIFLKMSVGKNHAVNNRFCWIFSSQMLLSKGAFCFTENGYQFQKQFFKKVPADGVFLKKKSINDQSLFSRKQQEVGWQ